MTEYKLNQQERAEIIEKELDKGHFDRAIRDMEMRKTYKLLRFEMSASKAMINIKNTYNYLSDKTLKRIIYRRDE